MAAGVAGTVKDDIGMVAGVDEDFRTCVRRVQKDGGLFSQKFAKDMYMRSDMLQEHSKVACSSSGQVKDMVAVPRQFKLPSSCV